MPSLNAIRSVTRVALKLILVPFSTPVRCSAPPFLDLFCSTFDVVLILRQLDRRLSRVQLVQPECVPRVVAQGKGQPVRPRRVLPPIRQAQERGTRADDESRAIGEWQAGDWEARGRSLLLNIYQAPGTFLGGKDAG